MVGFDEVFYIFSYNMEKQQKVDDGFAIMAVPISCIAPQDDVLKVSLQKFPQLFIIHILRFLILFFLKYVDKSFDAFKINLPNKFKVSFVI